jgi:hypothetical protein
MDSALLFLYRGFKHDELGRFVHVVYNIKLMKVNLEYDFPFYPHVQIDATVSNQGHGTESAPEGNSVPMSSVQFLPFEKQPWTSYLGKKGNSVYEP